MQQPLRFYEQLHSVDSAPFQNPICKETFQSLPRIYGSKKNRNKNYLKIQSKYIKYDQNHNQKQIKYSLSPDLMRGISRYMLTHHYHQRMASDRSLISKIKVKTQGDQHRSSTLRKQYNLSNNHSNKSSNNKILLKPILSQSKCFSLSQIQKQDNKFRDSRIFIDEHSYELNPRKKSSKDLSGKIKQSEKKIRKINHSTKLPDNENFKKSNANIQKKYQLQNKFQVCNEQSQQNQQDISEPAQRKKQKLSKNVQSQTYSSKQNTKKEHPMTSSRLGQNGSNQNQMTMFINLEKRHYSKLNSCRQSRASQHQSNGLFVIPQEEEYKNYIQKYQPIGTNFSLKMLVKRPRFKIIRDPKSVYFGEVNDQDQRHGLGVTVSQKQIFEGQYKSNFRIQGFQRNIDGVYIGGYKNGLRSGQGQFKWNNGQIFKGTWANGMKNGFGKWKSPHGHFYQGEWLHNRQHGNGIFRHSLSTYKGQFFNFLKHGKGQQVFRNGDKYKGEYKQGKPQGKGKYQWSSGGYYQGEFKKGRRQGNGIWVDHDCVRYQGQFKQDCKNGKGTQIFPSGQKFEGLFKNGQRSTGAYYNNKNQQISSLSK